jgi:NADH dehydrogenase (ubiquinone) 1 alpha/beta subcomplex 1
MALEEEFMITIPDAEAEKILSVEDAINFIATHPQAK